MASPVRSNMCYNHTGNTFTEGTIIMSQETVVALAVVLAGAIGMPLVEGIKRLVEASGKRLEGLPALYVTGGVSVLLAAAALWLSGAFSHPMSVELIGGSIASVFAIATVVYKHLADSLNKARAEREYKKEFRGG